MKNLQEKRLKIYSKLLKESLNSLALLLKQFPLKIKNSKKGSQIKLVIFLGLLLLGASNMLLLYEGYFLINWPQMAAWLAGAYFLMVAISAYVFVFYFRGVFLFYRFVFVALVIAVKLLGSSLLIPAEAPAELFQLEPELDSAYFLLFYNYLVLLGALDYGALLLYLVPFMNLLLGSLELYHWNWIAPGALGGGALYMKGEQPSQLIKLLAGQPKLLPNKGSLVVPLPKTEEHWKILEKLSMDPLLKGGNLTGEFSSLPFSGKLQRWGDYLGTLVQSHKGLLDYLRLEELQPQATANREFLRAFSADSSHFSMAGFGTIFQQLYPGLESEELYRLIRSTQLQHYSNLCSHIRTVELPLVHKCAILENDGSVAAQIKNLIKAVNPNVWSLEVTIRDNLCGVDSFLRQNALEVKQFLPADNDACVETAVGLKEVEVKRTVFSGSSNLQVFLEEKFVNSPEKLKGSLNGVLVLDCSPADSQQALEAIQQFNASQAAAGGQVKVFLRNLRVE